MATSQFLSVEDDDALTMNRHRRLFIDRIRRSFLEDVSARGGRGALVTFTLTSEPCVSLVSVSFFSPMSVPPAPLFSVSVCFLELCGSPPPRLQAATGKRAVSLIPKLITF